MLAAIQLLLAVYCVVAAVVMSAEVTAPADNLTAAALLLLLGLLTLLAVPARGALLMNTVVASTSALIAVATAIRDTGQGQLAMGVFLLMLCMWMAAFLRPRMAVPHILLACALYVLALAVNPHTGSPLYATALLVGIAFASAMVLYGREARSRYVGLVGSSADVILRSAHGRLTWVSASVEEVLGWTPREFVGLPEPTWHADDDETVQRMRRELYAGSPAQGTYRLRHKDGTYRWVEARLNPIAEDDAPQGAIGSLRDVTERVLAELALADTATRQRRGLRRMRRDDAAKTRMVHDLSHELRTPLTVIRGPLERHLRRDRDLPDSLRQDIETAVRASRRLESIVNDILDAERLATRPVLELVPTHVAEVTGETIRLLVPGAQAAGLTLELTTATGFPDYLLVDTDAWTRIVQNLVANALKYTERGGVQVDLSYEDGAIVLAVVDTGRGIAEADLENIFERFYTAGDRPARGAARSGLGLPMVADAVHEGGGHIDVSSELGTGTTFVVTMPAEPCDANTGPIARPAGLQLDREVESPGEPVGDAIVLLMADGGRSFEQALAELRSRAGSRPLPDVAAELLAEAGPGDESGPL